MIKMTAIAPTKRPPISMTGIYRSSAARMSNARPDSVRSIIRFRSSATSLSIGLGADAGSGPDCISLHGVDSSFPCCPMIRPLRTRMAVVNRKLGASRLRLLELHPEKFGDKLLRPRSVGDWVRALRRNRSRSEAPKGSSRDLGLHGCEACPAQAAYAPRRDRRRSGVREGDVLVAPLCDAGEVRLGRFRCLSIPRGCRLSRRNL